MKSCRAIAFAVAGLSLPLVSLHAQAAEMRVLASTAVKSVLGEVGPQFERATGNKLVFSFGPAAALKDQIDKGAPFDVAILTAPMIDALTKSGKVNAASGVTFARAGLGVAVHVGRTKPDVSTDDAFKTTLLNAQSIGYNGVGASRGGIEATFKKLGIADKLKPKIKLLDESAPVAVAFGRVAIGLGPISEVLPVAGADLVGPFPADLQYYLVFSIGESRASNNASADNLLIEYLKSPSVAPVLKSKGMEPG